MVEAKEEMEVEAKEEIVVEAKEGMVDMVEDHKPGMKKLSDLIIDIAILSNPTFLSSRTPDHNIPSGTSSALNYFLLFFDNEIIDTICEKSNRCPELYQNKYH